MKIYILIFLTLIIPWIIGINIYHKDKKIILVIAPFSSMLSFVLNTPGIEYGLFYPQQVTNIRMLTLSILPSIGSFCILPCMFIFCIRHSKLKPIILNIIFIIVGSMSDLMFIAAGFLKYSDQWNIYFSAIGFFISYNIIYLYYLLLKKLTII